MRAAWIYEHANTLAVRRRSRQEAILKFTIGPSGFDVWRRRLATGDPTEGERIRVAQRGLPMVALARMGQGPVHEGMLQASGLLAGLWFARGRYQEGRSAVEQALAQSGPTGSAARVRALVSAGMLARFHGDYARAGSLLADGLALARSLDDALLAGEALTAVSALAMRRGDDAQTARRD